MDFKAEGLIKVFKNVLTCMKMLMNFGAGRSRSSRRKKRDFRIWGVSGELKEKEILRCFKRVLESLWIRSKVQGREREEHMQSVIK